MNNDTRVKARGQPGLLHCPRQPGCASVDSGKAAGRRKISVSYSSAGVAARWVNGPTLGSVAISLQHCHRMGKEGQSKNGNAVNTSWFWTLKSRYFSLLGAPGRRKPGMDVCCPLVFSILPVLVMLSKELLCSSAGRGCSQTPGSADTVGLQV